jgi:hypothetical protein
VRTPSFDGGRRRIAKKDAITYRGAGTQYDIERVGALTNWVRKNARTGGREWNG